jgi:hypothetical protein
VIDFDDMMAADERRDPRVAIVLGLVTAERPKHGDFLKVEAECYLETSRVPQAVFIEIDDATGIETLGNGVEFQRAMDSMEPITETEALAWSREQTGAAYDRWRDRINAAWLEDQERR